jgi:hypothetical protein
MVQTTLTSLSHDESYRNDRTMTFLKRLRQVVVPGDGGRLLSS